MTMMLHSPQVHGFFGIPTDPLTSRPVFEHYFKQRDLRNTIVVAPDMGHAKSAARFARNLGLSMAAGNKERISDTQVRITGIVGEQVMGCQKALIYDDEIATGGSILEMARILTERGVREIWATCTHAAFAGHALDRLVAVPEITEIVTTDTVYIPPERRHPKLQVLSVGHIFGEAIRRNCMCVPIGDLLVFADSRT
jgi:ribose-phosphate pyrophosphokinase